jgi:hypothetical protein
MSFTNGCSLALEDGGVAVKLIACDIRQGMAVVIGLSKGGA